MLRTRILTAVALLAVFLPGLYYLPQFEWALLTLGLAAVGGWEWGAFMRLAQTGRWAMGGAIAIGGLLILFADPAMLGVGVDTRIADALPVLALSLAFWLVLVPLWLRYKWPLGKGLGAILLGFVLLVPTWIGVVQLRLLGPGWLLAIMAAVWVADVGAYFFGKQFGKHKLARLISPGKTWEGAVGGGLLVLVYALAVRFVCDGDRFPLTLWISAAVLLAVFSVIGDLFESLLKRQVGLKDSSGALPGHGGVLDRIDSLTSVLPLACLLVVLVHEGGA